MQKKYQVFISSTYTDLIEERKKAQEILLMADCIPAGMEAFVAANDEQFEVIKKVIDLCDYYVLIIGGRYGSISPVTGISYTEMEYDYAVTQNIPILVFAIDESVKLSADKKESDKHMEDKLKAFRLKTLSNRMASLWKNTDELGTKILGSIAKAKEEIIRPGYVRGAKYNISELLEQINTLRIEKDKAIEDCKILSEELRNFSFSEEEEIFKDQKIIIGYTKIEEYTVKKFIGTKSERKYYKAKFECCWNELYDYIAPYFYDFNTSSELNCLIKKYIGKQCYSVNDNDVLRIKHQMLALNYIQIKKVKRDSFPYDMVEYFCLTKKGIYAMNKLLLKIENGGD